MDRLVECVPNFSEGRNRRVIDAIAATISGTDGVELLDVDPGADTNRTVMTMVGAPDRVVEAAFRAIETASNLIDMSKHKGEHPRMGATDVCPFVPVRGITMEDCVLLAHNLGKRIGEELQIPVYLYEAAATTIERKNLAFIREGEYEKLADKIVKAEWKPDYGPAKFNSKSGATVIGARQFLVAYNINLNTRSKKIAHKIALEVRERGRAKRDEHGAIMKDENGQKIMQPGLLKSTKAVGWYIDGYDRAQVSMNLTDFEVTPPHIAFETCMEVAMQYGVYATGSEIVGLVPLNALLSAGRYFLQKQGLSTGIPERKIIATAIQSLGLNELAGFNMDEKIIEYRVSDPKRNRLVSMTCRQFSDELSTDSPAPGGGSVAALSGALAAALSGMVANLTIDKKGYDSVKSQMIEIADQGQALKDAFLADVDRDTDAFNQLMSSFALPKNTPELAEIRKKAIIEATKQATLVPLGVLERSLLVLDLALLVAKHGNQNSLSDSGVSIYAAQTSGEGAYLNVTINLRNLEDPLFVEEISQKARQMRVQLHGKVAIALSEVQNRLNIA
jgi:glutamate formiminotransferase / formiminotetrahydrofolate cyclodeaminase